MDSVAALNKEAFKNGKAILKSLIDKQMVGAMAKAINGLLVNAEFAAEYHHLTGNTLTSLMGGIYVRGTLVRIISVYDADMGLDRPTRRKLQPRGYKSVHLVKEYGTGEDAFISDSALIETDGRYGEDTSRDFLKGRHPKGEYAFVMTTGTEYSEYLESSRKLNVLSETFAYTGRTFLSSLKPIP